MTTQGGPKPAALALWGLKFMMATAFVAAGSLKLMGQPVMVAEFGLVGLGQWFRLFTGAVEISGAALMLWPKTSRYGATMLLAVSLGALPAQAFRIHGGVVHVFVFIALMGLLTVIAWRTPKPA